MRRAPKDAKNVYRALICALVAMAPVTGIHAQSAVPVRELNKPDAISTARFGNILAARVLPNGSVIVNDGGRRQVLLLNSTLGSSAVVIDSSGTNVQTYGSHATAIIPYVSDSLLFVDTQALSLVVIDPSGKIARVMAPPNKQAMQYLWRYPAGFDSKGRFIFRSQFAEKYVPAKTGSGIMPVFPDSAPIMRADLDTRKVDTIWSHKIQVNGVYKPSIDPDGKLSMVQLQQVIATIDDWAVLSDGSIAIVRGHDYHVDIMREDGTKVSGPKLPFDFKRFTDEDKQKMIDSAKAAEEKRNAEVRSTNSNARAAAGGGGAPQPRPFLPLSEMPDYYPPIRVGAAQADRDGNLWILPTTSAQSRNGELVYDVVNNRGELKYRVRMPAGRSVTGFGPNGVVLVISKDKDGWLLERTKLGASNPS